MSDVTRPGWVLLVEDDPDDRELAMHALKRGRVEMHVEVARDGVEALDLLHGRGEWHARDSADLPCVVVLDQKMPRLDGIDVLRELKQDAVLREVPVVMLTSSAEEGDLAACYRLGANSYVVKPVDIDQFFEAVQQIGLYWVILNRPHREAGRGAETAFADR